MLLTQEFFILLIFFLSVIPPYDTRQHSDNVYNLYNPPYDYLTHIMCIQQVFLKPTVIIVQFLEYM